jgi:hypothetical protein
LFLKGIIILGERVAWRIPTGKYFHVMMMFVNTSLEALHTRRRQSAGLSAGIRFVQIDAANSGAP